MARDDLQALRESINQIDDRLLDLLNERAQISARLTAHTPQSARVSHITDQERATISRLEQANPGPFPMAAIRPVFEEVIDGCLSSRRGTRVAYLGPEATFTHQAVKRHFGASTVGIPCGSIAGVFEEVERGQADHGVVPVENSTEGVVNHTLDSFIESPLRICAEVLVDVDHALLAQSGTVESDIERIYSHRQALGQCRKWLAENLPRATLIECPSTTDAGHRAAADPGGAAIASELAARICRLDVLRRRLQDVGHNVTRFLVIEATEPKPAGAGDTYKTSLLLAAPDEAGFLFGILEPLAAAKINLTKIESRPSRRQLWDYVFYIDLDGHFDDERVAPALELLSERCELFKILGSYPRAD